jgi:hypothetical protein
VFHHVYNFDISKTFLDSGSLCSGDSGGVHTLNQTTLTRASPAVVVAAAGRARLPKSEGELAGPRWRCLRVGDVPGRSCGGAAADVAGEVAAMCC